MCPSNRPFPFHLSDQLAFRCDFCIDMGRYHSPVGIDRKGHMSRSDLNATRINTAAFLRVLIDRRSNTFPLQRISCELARQNVWRGESDQR